MAQPWPPRRDINNDKLYSERFIESTICGWCLQSLGPGWPLRYILLLPRLPCPQFVNYFTKLQIIALLLYLTWRNVVQILWVYRMVKLGVIETFADAADWTFEYCTFEHWTHWNICGCQFDSLAPPPLWGGGSWKGMPFIYEKQVFYEEKRKWHQRCMLLRGHEWNGF